MRRSPSRKPASMRPCGRNGVGARHRQAGAERQHDRPAHSGADGRKSGNGIHDQVDDQAPERKTDDEAGPAPRDRRLAAAPPAPRRSPRRRARRALPLGAGGQVWGPDDRGINGHSAAFRPHAQPHGSAFAIRLVLGHRRASIYTAFFAPDRVRRRKGLGNPSVRVLDCRRAGLRTTRYDTSPASGDLNQQHRDERCILLRDPRAAILVADEPQRQHPGTGSHSACR